MNLPQAQRPVINNSPEAEIPVTQSISQVTRNRPPVPLYSRDTGSWIQQLNQMDNSSSHATSSGLQQAEGRSRPVPPRRLAIEWPSNKRKFSVSSLSKKKCL